MSLELLDKRKERKNFEIGFETWVLVWWQEQEARGKMKVRRSITQDQNTIKCATTKQ